MIRSRYTYTYARDDSIESRPNFKFENRSRMRCEARTRRSFLRSFPYRSTRKVRTATPICNIPTLHVPPIESILRTRMRTRYQIVNLLCEHSKRLPPRRRPKVKRTDATSITGLRSTRRTPRPCETTGSDERSGHRVRGEERRKMDYAVAPTSRTRRLIARVADGVLRMRSFSTTYRKLAPTLTMAD